jgi:hypothetical protein
VRVLENKPALEQSSGHDPPALQDQLAFGLHDQGTDFEHPSRRWESEASAGCLTQEALWRERFIHALELSLRVLAPHRMTLRALIPVLVGDPEEGVLAQSTAFSRVRVQTVFENAVIGATDAPKAPLAGALGRLLYVLHLGVILWWLLDRSPGQKATAGLVRLFRRMLPSAAVALRVPPVRHFVRSLDALIVEALMNGPSRQ